MRNNPYWNKSMGTVRVGQVLVGGRSGGMANQRVPAKTVRTVTLPTGREFVEQGKRDREAGNIVNPEGGILGT